MISIHALLAESDLPGPRLCPSRGQFLSTLSLRRATLYHRIALIPHQQISIHALLAESDRSAGPWQAECTDFYPRSPCGERRHLPHGPASRHSISIHALLAESDGPEKWSWPRRSRISIHALLAESDRRAPTPQPMRQISIHALLAESDTNLLIWESSAKIFLSTLSLRRATDVNGVQGYRTLISIHALLAESDSTTTIIICTVSKFLSTLSLRRATVQRGPRPHQGGHFYPRSPCGERRPTL